MGVTKQQLGFKSTCDQEHVNNKRMEKTAILGAYCFVIFYICYWVYQIKEAGKI
jgi:hypothetical protein